MNGCFRKPCLLLNPIEQFPKFQSNDINNFYPENRECLYSENTKFYQKQSPRGVQICNFIKKETLAQVFFCEFCQISKNIFSYRTPPVAASVLWWWNFLFSMFRLSSFLNFMKTWANFTKITLREVWPWHSRSKICKVNGKSSLKFCKLIFCR